MRLNRIADDRGANRSRFLVSRAMLLGLLALMVLSPLLATYAPSVSAQESGASEPASGNVIVVLHDSVQLAEAADIADEFDNAITFGAVLNGFAVALTPEEAAELADDPRVAGIYPDEPVYLAEEYTNSLGVRRIGASSAHVDLSEGLPPTVNATVAVLDSGVLYNHPNLNVVGGFDAWSAGAPETGATNCGALTPQEQAAFEGNGPNTWGASTNPTHGTLVSGIISANGVNGVTGVAPGAGIVSIKVAEEQGLQSRLLCGLAWLQANKARFGGIDVANMSLQWSATAGNCDSDALHIAICTLVYGGMPVVIANGNSNATVPMNTYAEVIAVSAMNDYDGRPGGIATVKPSGCSSTQSNSSDDRFATYNIAGASDYMAPGTCVWSTTVNGGYGFPSTGGGSSFAAPHVAGAIAVYAGTNPSPSDAAARAYLNGVSVPISDPDGIIGSGGDGARMLRLGPSPVFGQISPVSGAPSAKINYTLTGFPANAPVTITWEKAAGGTIALGTTQTDAAGEATGQVVVPDTAPGGPGQKLVFTSGNFVKSFTFETRPRIRFHQPSASPGGTVLVNGRGFAANDLLTVRWRNADGVFVNIGTVTTNSNGNFTNLSLTVPAWAPTGTNTVRMQGTLSQNTSSLTVIVPSVQIAPVRTTVNNWVNYDLSNFPPDTTVTITWTRLTGSTIDMGTVQTDEAGNASDRIRVPATPGGPGQKITFAGSGVSETVLFEVAPRIKSNTSPAVRGGQADISLRGFARQESFIIRWRNPQTGVWVLVGSGTTSNTGSANVMVTVPNFAPDGNNSVRADSPSFNQQTNVVLVSGGAPFNPAEEPTPTPTPEPEETPVTIDTSALPLEAPLTLVEITDDALTPNLRITLTDGQLDTTWSATPDPVRQDARLVIELGAPHQVWGLGWLTEAGGCGQLLQVEYSIDGETWLPVDPYLVPGAIGEPMVWRYFGANVEAAYLRLTIGQAEAGQSPLGCIAEAKVWGTPLATETPTPEPIPTEPPADIEPEESPAPDESTTDPAAEPTTDQDGDQAG